MALSEVQWEALNPARGDSSPRAGTLWGDRNGSVPTGFLARFVEGFSSPPHIHNATYRAVVIRGLLHNDDPAAEPEWMPAGSFWTQPAGDVHITAANAQENIALVEIDRGPYLVKPPEAAFDNGERAINVDASNLVWVEITGDTGAKIAYLSGALEAGRLNSTFLRLPAGFSGELLNAGNAFHAVVIEGGLSYGGADAKRLTPGGYFGAADPSAHAVTTDAQTTLYVRTNGPYEITQHR
ncbi:MAG: DUF4437 domain-containing protein [Pseudomonadota bacterium]